MVYLELSQGLPKHVWWERFESPDAAALAKMQCVLLRVSCEPPGEVQ